MSRKTPRRVRGGGGLQHGANPQSVSGALVPGAVLYCRVSTKEQVENLSLPTQQQRCAEYCQRKGFTVLRVFCRQR